MERAKQRLGRVYTAHEPPHSPAVRRGDIEIEYLRGALDSVAAIVYTIDRSFRIRMVNAEWDRFALEHGGAGVTSDAIVGRNLLDAIKPPQRDELRAICEAIFCGERRQHRIEVDCSTPRRPAIFRLIITPLRSSRGQIIGATFTSHNITELKRLEAEAAEQQRRRANLFHVLSQISERLASELDEQAIMQFVTQALVEQLRLAFARVWLFDPATETLILRSSAGMYTHTDGEFGRIKLGQRIVGQIAATRRPFVTDDVPSEPGLGDRAWAIATGMRGFAGYPLVARGQLLGVAGFFSGEAFDDELVALLEPVAHQVALALERANLYVAQVAARREAQSHARLAKSRAAQLSATLAAMGDGVWTCDHQGALHTVNDAALAMFGLPINQPRPATIDEIPALFADESTDRETCFGLRAALAGHTHRGEYVLEPAGGTHAPVVVSVTATPVRDTAGNVVGAVAVVRDMTQQRVMEDLRDDFLTVAAHELKTPVTAIKGYAQLALARLRSGSEGQLLRRALQTIDEQAERMAHLVTELVDVSRIRGGKLDLRHEPFDLVALVRKHAEQISMDAPDHQLTLDAPEALEVVGDALRIEQVILNLLDNAVKYSPAGGTIDVAVQAIDGAAHVTVRDHGIGIPPEQQHHIFEAWFQAHKDGAGDYGGMGLGLNICKEIVERHGGTIWVESDTNQGSLFGFKLPLAAQRAIEAGANG